MWPKVRWRAKCCLPLFSGCVVAFCCSVGCCSCGCGCSGSGSCSVVVVVVGGGGGGWLVVVSC